MFFKECSNSFWKGIKEDYSTKSTNSNKDTGFSTKNVFTNVENQDNAISLDNKEEEYNPLLPKIKFRSLDDIYEKGGKRPFITLEDYYQYYFNVYGKPDTTYENKNASLKNNCFAGNSANNSVNECFKAKISSVDFQSKIHEGINSNPPSRIGNPGYSQSTENPVCSSKKDQFIGGYQAKFAVSLEQNEFLSQKYSESREILDYSNKENHSFDKNNESKKPEFTNNEGLDITNEVNFETFDFRKRNNSIMLNYLSSLSKYNSVLFNGRIKEALFSENGNGQPDVLFENTQKHGNTFNKFINDETKNICFSTYNLGKIDQQSCLLIDNQCILENKRIQKEKLMFTKTLKLEKPKEFRNSNKLLEFPNENNKEFITHKKHLQKCFGKKLIGTKKRCLTIGYDNYNKFDC